MVSFGDLGYGSATGIGLVLGFALYGVFCVLRGGVARVKRNLPPL